MEKPTAAMSAEMEQIAEHARALVTATADVAGEKVTEARKRLAAALESGRDLCGQARDKAVAGAKVADEVVRENPYQAIAVAFGLGAVLGFLITRGGGSNRG